MDRLAVDAMHIADVGIQTTLGWAPMWAFFQTVLILAVFTSGLIPSPIAFCAEAAPEVVAVALRDWPPQFVTDAKTGGPDGFAIDVMNKVAESIGLNIRYVVYDDWPKAFEALRTKKAIVAPNLGITEERLDLYDFTLPYETFRIVMVVRSASGDIDNAGGLVGKKVGVVEKNQGQALMQAQAQSDLQVFKSIEEAFLALLSGSVEALVCPESPIMGIAARSGLENKIRIVGKPLQEIPRAIAVIKGEPELFAKLDKAVGQFVKTAEYHKIYQKWHGTPEPFWNATRLGLLMGLMLGLVVAGMLVWRYVSIVRLNRFLAEAEERFRGIVENACAGYFFIDKEGRFQRVNNAWLQMHGYDNAHEVIGQPFTLTQVDTDLDAAKQNMQTLFVGRPIPSGQFTRRCKDGLVGYHIFSAHPVVRGGQVVGIEGFIIDTSEAHRLEEQKRKLEARLWQAKKAESLGRMAGAIAHHFNNQLSAKG